MKTLTLYLKISTFLLLIWMYQCFYNCDSYKTLIDKYILQTKNELKYERILTEGNTERKEQTNTQGGLKECPLNNEKKGSMDPDKYKNPYNYWFKFKLPKYWDRFKNETSGMDQEWIQKKWNVDFQIFSNKKFNDLLYPIIRSNIPDKQKKENIDSFMNEFDLEFDIFLFECKNNMAHNKTKYKSKKDMTNNETESESKNEMTDNKIESEYMKDMTDNKTESESNKDMRENIT
ncbi:fam-g protein [Plasmodium gallinaceum]|uniref:Fam-g protein n=1 Tax=Plasmodium gallinaceum TaxID=5849 RepID=A0A1J1GU67_PLAGA|nr:fam-g protein [Plasmodium gallinaceum]CRG96026.1 fam-g protein [Plasmodium gallinaceum]